MYKIAADVKIKLGSYKLAAKIDYVSQEPSGIKAFSRVRRGESNRRRYLP